MDELQLTVWASLGAYLVLGILAAVGWAVAVEIGQLVGRQRVATQFRSKPIRGLVSWIDRKLSPGFYSLLDRVDFTALDVSGR